MTVEAVAIQPTLTERLYGGVTGSLRSLAGLVSGATKFKTMQPNPRVPASAGTVRIRSEGNDNTRLAIRVRHLAHPEKLESDSSVYVAWVRSQDGTQQNVGALKLNANLEGRLDTVTPHRWFQLTITPEPSGHAVQPTHEPVFSADVERPARFTPRPAAPR